MRGDDPVIMGYGVTRAYGVPRMRGDDPADVRFDGGVLKSSPHARG